MNARGGVLDIPTVRQTGDALALPGFPPAEPVPAVFMTSSGRLLIVGERDVAMGWAERLAGKVEVAILATGVGDQPQDMADWTADERIGMSSGEILALSGYLGAFIIDWQDGVAGARRSDRFDLVLDLSEPPLIRRTALPDGYRAPGRDPLDQALAVIDLMPLLGEFEKPCYVAVRKNLCAHSRARQSGCDNCLKVCAAEAIVGKGDAVEVDPYLCQGCGACATVCPSGAMRFQYPRVSDLGRRLRVLLDAYRQAGGEAACLLFHGAEAGRRLLRSVSRQGGGLPLRMIPLETWSADAVGLDLTLAALALGAGQVAILAAGSHDPAPLKQQARIADAITAGLGFVGERVRVFEEEEPAALAAALHGWPAAEAVTIPADFAPSDEKRTNLDHAIAHLLAQAPQPVGEIPLPAGAPFGAVKASEACTLCMGCVSLCPAGALVAADDAPRLSFVERNCLQCGLCANSCPENALTLTPRLLLEGSRRERVLREAEIVRCSRCGKTLGARPLIEAVATRLAGHAMFASEAERARLAMCADCRVIDRMESEGDLQPTEADE